MVGQADSFWHWFIPVSIGVAGWSILTRSGCEPGLALFVVALLLLAVPSLAVVCVLTFVQAARKGWTTLQRGPVTLLMTSRPCRRALARLARVLAIVAVIGLVLFGPRAFRHWRALREIARVGGW